MATDDTLDVGEALETLVHQFADRWSFLRELIQNAIDAGSPEIEVRVEHEPPTPEPGSEPEAEADDPGLMCVEVLDAGEGMDREIIDTRLTRLFSSAKDGDYTKIGRFGIGFVSVFAIDPDLVCVDTGRAGEYWRVLFRKDRSFQRIALDQPTEGTTIRIYKRASEAEADVARGEARRVLEYWCKHARVEIRCEDEVISRPMALDGLCVIEHEEEGTRLLLGYGPERAGLRGYYHGGLTLHEERDEALPHVAFKIDSRYLEHTLTRDNVIRDDNYEKAMAIIGRLSRTRLLDELFAQLEGRTAGADAALQRPALAELEFLRGRLVDAYKAGVDLPKDALTRPLIPALDRGGGVSPVSLAEVRKQIKRAWLASAPTPVTEALVARGDRVLVYGPDSHLHELVRLHAERDPQLASSLVTATPATAVEAGRWAALRPALLALLTHLAKLGGSRGGVKLGEVVLGHLAYPGSPVAGHVAITQAEFGELTAVADIGQLDSGWFGSRRVVVINADHPTVAHLLELAESEAELAAYLLLKLFFLRASFELERDNAMANFTAEARCRRSTN